MTRDEMIAEAKRRRLIAQVQEQRAAAPEPDVQPDPIPTQPEREPSLLGRSLNTLQLGLSDAMSTAAGDTYGRSGDDTQRDDLNPLSKAIKMAGGDVLPAVGEVGGDVMIEAGKAVLPQAAEEAVASGARYVMGSRPVQAASRGLEKWREASPETHALAGELLNIGTAVLPVPKIKPKFGAKSRSKLKKSLQDRKRLETERLLEPDNLRGKGQLKEEGSLRIRKYKPSEQEARVAKKVSDIPDIDPRRSNNYNVGILDNEIDKLDDALVSSLEGASPVPLVTVTNAIDDAIDEAKRLPNLSGDAGTMAKTLSDQIDTTLAKYKSSSGQISPGNLLKVRRELDAWTKKYGPDLYSDRGSALSDANTKVREALNSTVAQFAPDADVRNKLYDMADMLEARKTLYPRSLPSAEKGNRVTRYVDNLERSLGIRHPSTPQSVAITAQNPVVGAGVGAGALGLGVARNIGKGIARNRTASAEMMADAIRGGSQGAQRAALLDILNEDEEND